MLGWESHMSGAGGEQEMIQSLGNFYQILTQVPYERKMNVEANTPKCQSSTIIHKMSNMFQAH